LAEKIDLDEKQKIMAGQLPEVMNALSGLHSVVVKDGALSDSGPKSSDFRIS
jgi:hypothetical protein